MRFSIRGNLLANYFGQGWSALASVIFVPIYIKYLGIESYGLVGVFTIILTVMTLMDGGMTPTLNREMARFSAGVISVQEAGSLLRSLEIGLVAILSLVVLLATAMVGRVSSHWLGHNSLSDQSLKVSLSLMIFVSALRLLEGLYRGALLGLHRHGWLNLIIAIMATVRSAGAAIAVSIMPTTIAFFGWQLFAGLISIITLATLTYVELGHSPVRFRFRFDALASVGRFASGVFVTAACGVVLTQLDKVLLSRLITLKSFGYYTLATTASNTIYQLVNPIAQTFYPRFTKFVAKGDSKALADCYHFSAQLLSFAIGPPAVMLALFAQPILLLWTHDSTIAENTAPLLSLLAVGTLLHGLIHLPYMLQLANGWSWFSAKVNLIAAFLLIPAILWAVPRYGALGGAAAWAALNVGYLLVSIQLMHRHLLSGEKWRWYIQDVLIPLSAVTLVAWLFSQFKSDLGSRAPPFVQLAFVGISLYVVAALSMSKVRRLLFGLIGMAA